MVRKVAYVKQGDLSDTRESYRSQSAHSSEEASVMGVERRERREKDT